MGRIFVLKNGEYDMKKKIGDLSGAAARTGKLRKNKKKKTYSNRKKRLFLE